MSNIASASWSVRVWSLVCVVAPPVGMLGAFLVGYYLESLSAILFFVAGAGTGAVALWMLSKAIDEDPALEPCADQLQSWLRWWNFLGGAQVFLFVWFPRGPFSGGNAA